MDTNREVIAASIETVPVALLPDQLTVLDLASSAEQTVNQVQTLCRQQCQSPDCGLSLELTTHEDDTLISATCNQCPNPELAIAAVNSVVNFADDCLNAVKDIEPVVQLGQENDVNLENYELAKALLHPTEYKENECHVITLEGLKMIVNDPKNTLPARLINQLERHRIHETFPEAFIKSAVLAHELKSDSDGFIVAEGIGTLIDNEQVITNIPNLGDKSIELLRTTMIIIAQSGLLDQQTA